jgi:hypothetical protein
MRSLIAFSIVLIFSTVLPAQNRSGFVNTPGVTRAFGSVVFPGGTSALPGVQRTTGSVVFPGGGGPQIGIPAAPLQGLGYTTFTQRNGIPGIGFGGGRFGNGNGNGNRGHRNNNNNGVVYAYPVYVGGGYYGGGYYGGDYYGNGYPDNGYGAAPPVEAPVQQQQQPNILVIYPPSATPTTLYPSEPGTAPPPSSSLYQPQPSQPAVESPASEEQATRYLIAFKDHTIYSAVAYWVDGDTLHYFTSGNTHNQASLSLVDRALTEKLNKDSGLEVKLPPAK